MPFERWIFEFSKFRKCLFWFGILSSTHNGLITWKNSTFLFTTLNCVYFWQNLWWHDSVTHSFSHKIWMMMMMIMTVTLRIKSVTSISSFWCMRTQQALFTILKHIQYLNLQAFKMIHLFLHNVALAMSYKFQIQIQPNRNITKYAFQLLFKISLQEQQ
jgi:hypothetical protein